MADNKLTIDEFFALFGRAPEYARWSASVDSEEYLVLVTYLVQQSRS